MLLPKNASFMVKVTCCFVLAVSLLTLLGSEAVVSGQPVSTLCQVGKLEIKPPFWVPYCANYPLDQPSQVERAVILINGVGREAALEVSVSHDICRHPHKSR